MNAEVTQTRKDLLAVKEIVETRIYELSTAKASGAITIGLAAFLVHSAMLKTVKLATVIALVVV